MIDMAKDYLAHHGILGMKWGKKNGPPYPLSDEKHSANEKKRGWKRSLDTDKKKKIGKAAIIAGTAALAGVSLYALYRNDQSKYANAASVLDYINNANKSERKTDKYKQMSEAAGNIAKRYKKRYDINQQLDQGIVDKRHRVYEGLRKQANRVSARNERTAAKRVMKDANKRLDTELRNAKKQAVVDKRNARKANFNAKVNTVKSAYQTGKNFFNKAVQPVKTAAKVTKKVVNATSNFVNRRVRKQPGGRLATYTVKNRRMYSE